MIKLLCVTGNIYPPKTGGDQAVTNAFKLLQNELDLHVFVLGSSPKEESISQFKHALPQASFGYFNTHARDRYETVHQICLRIKKLLHRLANVNPENYEIERLLTANTERNMNIYEALNKYIVENDIDVVQFEFASSLFWAQGITAPVKKVFVQHEINYVVKEQRLSQNCSTREKLICGIYKNREIAMQNAYDAIITLQEEDTKRLVKDGVSVPIFTSFAKVQIRDADMKDYKSVNSIDLVFVGPESHIPNKHGLLWFVSEVWDKILAKNPNIKLHVIGKWSDKTVNDWAAKYKNLIFEGFVDDLVPALQEKIMIVPIYEGSGIRMKILEAANIGVPFVSCTVGAEGLLFTSGKDCFITDDPVEFADIIIRLLSDRELLNVIANNAKKHVRDNFSDEKFIQTRMCCYQNVINASQENKLNG